MDYYRPTRAEISLDALARNIAAFRAALPSSTRLMASVKANAYGHGAAVIAREALRCGVDLLGVAFLDEALQLRRAGIEAPVLVLGYTGPQGLEAARAHDIAVTLFREDVLAAAAELPKSGKPLRVHVKIDTGMGRLGLLAEDRHAWQAFLEQIATNDAIELEGIFTHFARADEQDKSYTALQHKRFQEIAAYARERFSPRVLIHAGNSATGIDTPEWAGDLLRLGIGMYGLYPSAEVNGLRIPLEPILTLKTEIVMVKEAPPGWGISYGSRYVTAARERIGTLPVGYADGYSRMLTGKTEVLVRGQRVPVRGAICMDQCMIAVDEAHVSGKPVEAGEEVVLLGRQGEQQISADELADKLGTLNYELVCMLAARVPRIYWRNGQLVEVVNPLV